MEYEGFDNVKYEKDRSMERFNRFRKIMKMLQFIQVVVVFMLISWSWTRLPPAVKLSVYLFNPHVVFLIGNTIIVVIILLCRQTEANNSKPLTANFNHEDVSPGDVQLVTEKPVSSPASLPDMAEPDFTGDENKQTVCSESKVPNKVQSNNIEEEMATKKIKILERTQSEKLNRETAVNPKTELRRTKTDICRIVVRPGNRRQTKAVDTLSNEEFRLTIEAFIKKNQIFFETQRLAETEQPKYVN
ncbi:hypothetical protein K7X08_012350 [Anisodus acutangulus]|uniref:DUF4408 domain-containing protein n=1 Tax=Anisodus acutangulus TaxID=402998 RepID=A0A9Q1LD44_9SOLA|nr:hypothetical protein K7X08_012350 [Anisodus acutangulus]